MKRAASFFSAGISTLCLATSQAKAQTTKIQEQLPINYELNVTNDDLGQITNVNSLRDIAPTDWAYEALRSLVDRYGCIAGFPDQTFRGNQPLSRYEFAAGLNSCLNQIERLIASSENVSSDDLATVQRLAQDFAEELEVLGTRIDDLESRTAVMEDNQFSTTTKLNGEVIFSFKLSCI